MVVSIVYSTVYVVNSRGGYWPATQVGLKASPLALYCQPRLGYFVYRSADNDWLGCLFRPLISIDRSIFHVTIGNDIPGSYERSLRLRSESIHPARRSWFETNMLPVIEEVRKEGRVPGFNYL